MLQYLSLFVAYVMFIYSVYIQLLFVCYNYTVACYLHPKLQPQIRMEAKSLTKILLVTKIT